MMIRNVITPNIVSTFGTLFVCTTLMLWTNLNMAPAIALNLFYCAFADSAFGQQFRRIAGPIFDVSPWKPYRFAFTVSTTIALYATICIAVLQCASRLLWVLLTLTRSRTTEQNLTALAAQWNSFSVLFVKDSFAEKFAAITTFICIMLACFLMINLCINDIYMRGRISLARNIRRVVETRNIVQPTLATEEILRAENNNETVRVQQLLRGDRVAAEISNHLANVEKLYHAKRQLENVMRMTRVNNEADQVLEQVLPELMQALLADDQKEEKEEQQKVQPPREEEEKEDAVLQKVLPVNQVQVETDSVANQLPNGFMAEDNCQATVEDDTEDAQKCL